MNYREVAPRAELAPYVKCFWLVSGPATGRVEHVVPDGCCEIILNLADPFRDLAGTREQPDIMVVGQIRRFIRIVPTGVVDLVGIRFRPGGLYAVLGVPMPELGDARVDVHDVAPRLRAELEDAARGGLARLENVLLGRLRPSAGETRAAVDVIERTAGRARIDDVTARVGVNGRKLERLFRRDVGLPPKLLARIVRFQNVIATVERNARSDWATVALDCGYYDQAHLINDFRRFAGMSPTRYFSTEHPMADFFAGVGFFQSGPDAGR